MDAVRSFADRLMKRLMCANIRPEEEPPMEPTTTLSKTKPDLLEVAPRKRFACNYRDPAIEASVENPGASNEEIPTISTSLKAPSRGAVKKEPVRKLTPRMTRKQYEFRKRQRLELKTKKKKNCKQQEKAVAATCSCRALF